MTYGASYADLLSSFCHHTINAPAGAADNVRVSRVADSIFLPETKAV